MIFTLHDYGPKSPSPPAYIGTKHKFSLRREGIHTNLGDKWSLLMGNKWHSLVNNRIQERPKEN